MSLFPVLSVLPFRTSQAIATGAISRRSFLKRNVRLSSKGIDCWRGPFSRGSAESTAKKHCAKCVTAAVRAVESPLSLLSSSTSRPCLSFGPVCLPTGDQTQIQFSRPRSRETTIYSFKQTLLSLPLSLFLFLFFSSSFFPSSGPLVCPWTDAALVKREFQDFQIALRSLETLLENFEERTFFRSFCIETSCRSVLCIYIFLVEWQE